MMLITSVDAWNEKKKQFSKRQITLALDGLSKKGWISHFALTQYCSLC